MKILSITGVALKATLVNIFINHVSAHSWVEYAVKLAANGTMVGEKGYPRGWFPRTDPRFRDTDVQNRLPPDTFAYYSGQENLNKFKFDANPEFPLLEAAAGDYVAVVHLENGHTTLPNNQADKPRNRGTIYFYGTTKPKEEEKLLDVHLLWNKDGTGGDGRGRLLATRNYDDGQCFQTNDGPLSVGRAAEFADRGAEHDKELACQSDIKLPSDLQVGDTYTIYWYWDWPDLNFSEVDEEGTKKGLFPWAGTFMRGETDPHGFTMAGIKKNESYSSVIDIKIVDQAASGLNAKGSYDVSKQFLADQDIYSMGILEQMSNNFQVDVDGNQGGGSGTGSVPTPTKTVPATVPTTSAPGNGNGGGNGGIATVTVTTTVQPPPSVTTVYVTVPAESMTGPPPVSTPRSTSTYTKIITKTRGQADGASSVVSEPASTPQSTSTVTKTILTTIKHDQGTMPAAADSTSTVKLTRTTVQTMTTKVPNVTPTAVSPESTSVSFPGGQFRETPVSSPAGVPTPSPFLRRRGNWAFF